jgi:hypothetical protein
MGYLEQANKLPEEFEAKLDDLFHRWKNVLPITLTSEIRGEKEWYIDSIDMHSNLDFTILGDSRASGGVVEISIELVRTERGGLWRASGKVDNKGKIHVLDEPLYPRVE